MSGTLTWFKPWQYSNYNPNGTLRSSGSGTVKESNKDTKPDKPTRTKRVQNWRPPTSYARTIESGDCNSIYVTADYVDKSGYRYVRSGHTNFSGGWYSSPPAAPSYLTDSCVLRCLTKLKGQKINLSQNIGERKQTARLVTESCFRIYQMVKNTKRTALHLATDPFNLWLELQYGWKPLLQDVHGAINELEAKDYPARVTVAARAQERFYLSNTMQWVMNTINTSVDRVRKGVHNVHVRLDYEEDDNFMARKAAALGITNPLDVAWELLPWSFVVDWFYPVGNYFNILDATAGWSFKGGTNSSTTRMNTYPVNSRVWAGHNGAVSGISTAEGKGVFVKHSRLTYASSPLPDLPYLNDRSSSAHVANGIALLASAFTNSKRIIRL